MPNSTRPALPTDRLATTDEKGRRVWLYPTEVRGRFHDLRVRVRAALIILLMALPWIRINGHQAILLDIPRRRFSILGLTFWAHDAPMLFFVLAGAVLTLCFVTAVWGRAWCGWACPHTVFIDGVYRRIERWVEGDSVKRRRLDEAPWTSSKLLKKSLKWTLYSCVSLVISHVFLAYFVGTDRLLEMVRSNPFENPTTFAIMASATAATLFDFGWFREQFCTVVCPYGRFQSVLMDDHSLIVAYQAKRGEPRRGAVPPGEEQGDCVDCFKCVQACPYGIDIRRGVQLECIACTACIDACDDVMTRLKKPRGLIKFDTAAGDGRKTWARPRVWVYLGLLTSLAAGLATIIVLREPLSTALMRAAESPYREGSEGLVINHFKLDLGNQTFDPITARVTLDPESAAKGIKIVASTDALDVEAGKSRRVDFFVEFPKSALSEGRATGELRIGYHTENPAKDREIRKELKLVGPLR